MEGAEGASLPTVSKVSPKPREATCHLSNAGTGLVSKAVLWGGAPHPARETLGTGCALLWEDCPAHCGMFNNTPELYLTVPHTYKL